MDQNMQEEHDPLDQLALTNVLERFVDAWNRYDAKD
jgi:hypothetical protein